MQRRSAVWWTRAAPAQAARRVTSNFGEHFPILTYNGEDKPLGGVTYGGYSESIVVDEGFVLKVSENLNLAAVTPLLCAGSRLIRRCVIGSCGWARKAGAH